MASALEPTRESSNDGFHYTGISIQCLSHRCDRLRSRRALAARVLTDLAGSAVSDLPKTLWVKQTPTARGQSWSQGRCRNRLRYHSLGLFSVPGFT